MRVDHAGDDRFSCDVDHARAGAEHHRGFRVAADEDDAITTHGNRLRARTCSVSGIDAAVEQDEISLLSIRTGVVERAKCEDENDVAYQMILRVRSEARNLGGPLRL